MVKLNLVIEDLTLPLSPRIYNQSNFLSNVMENATEHQTLDLDVDKKDILKIVDFLDHHASHPFLEIEKPFKSDFKQLVKDPWDAQFISKEKDSSLAKLILAANYLDIPSLFNLLTAKLASVIQGRFHSSMDQDALAKNPWVLLVHNKLT